MDIMVTKKQCKILRELKKQEVEIIGMHTHTTKNKTVICVSPKNMEKCKKVLKKLKVTTTTVEECPKDNNICTIIFYGGLYTKEMYPLSMVYNENK